MARRVFAAAAAGALISSSLLMAGCGASNPSATSSASPAKAAAQQDFYVGERIQSSTLELNVTEVDTPQIFGRSLSMLNAGIDTGKSAPEGSRFVVIYYTVKNISHSPVDPDSIGTVILRDKSGNVYKEYDANILQTAERETGDLNPLVTRNKVAAFVVPKSEFDQNTWVAVFGGSATVRLVSRPKVAEASSPLANGEASAPNVGTGIGGTPGAVIFECATASGKRVRFLDRGESVEYSYGKPGSSPDVDLFAKKTDVEMGMVAGMGHHINFKTQTASYHVEQFKHADQTLSVTKGYWSESAPETQRYLSSIKCASGVVDNIPDE